MDCVFDENDYENLQIDKKYQYDILVIKAGKISPIVYEDQLKNNTNLKWVHSISAGIDKFLEKEVVKNSSIPLTNAKGAYSHILGEYVLLGVLYHSKLLEKFM